MNIKWRKSKRQEWTKVTNVIHTNYWLPLTTSLFKCFGFGHFPSKCSFLEAAVALGDHFPFPFPSFPRMSRLTVGGHQFIKCTHSIGPLFALANPNDLADRLAPVPQRSEWVFDEWPSWNNWPSIGANSLTNWLVLFTPFIQHYSSNGPLLFHIKFKLAILLSFLLPVPLFCYLNVYLNFVLVILETTMDIHFYKTQQQLISGLNDYIYMNSNGIISVKIHVSLF
jgi:hypothetical protein